MKFSIGQEVRELASGKVGIIRGTKEVPFINHHLRNEVYPSGINDYIIILKQSEGNYSGTMEVPEGNLELLS